MATWMLAHGSDVHQGGVGPLMRAALNGYRIPMMELLVSHGVDVNALWHGHFPIIFAPCESLDPAALKWLLDHGANPNCRDHGYTISGHSYRGTALDGADLGVRVKLPGDYERPGEIVECTALGYALRFGGPRQRRMVTLLRERGAVE
jgi:hypothetical protein